MGPVAGPYCFIPPVNVGSGGSGGVSNDSEATIYIHLVIEGAPLPLMKINQGLEQVPDSEPIKRRIVTEKDGYNRARAQFYIYEALQVVIPTPKALKLVTSVFLPGKDFTYIETKFLVEIYPAGNRVYMRQPDGSYAYHSYVRHANDTIEVWTTIEGPKTVVYKPGL